MEREAAILALALIGLGAGGWIGIGLAVLAFKGRFKFPAAAVFAVGGVALAIWAGDLAIGKPRAEAMLAHAEQHDPIFRLMLRVDPERHEPVLLHLQEAERRGGVAEVEKEMRNVAFETLAIHGLKLVPQASDAAADGYIDVMAEYLQSIYRRDPETCYVYLVESRHGSDYGMPPAMYRRMFDSMKAIVTSSASNPDPLSDDEREAASARLTEIWTGLQEGPEAGDFFTGMLDGEAASTPEQRKGTCLFMTRLYHRIAAQEAPMRGHILKVFYE